LNPNAIKLAFVVFPC